MTDPDTVARALARLASGDARVRETEPYSPTSDAAPADDGAHATALAPARVVADAEAAMQQLSRAAAFVDAGGEERLRGAIDRADAAGDDALAERGRAVLETLAAFRAAADPDSSHTAADSDTASATTDPVASTPSEARTTSTPLAQRSSGEGP